MYYYYILNDDFSNDWHVYARQSRVLGQLATTRPTGLIRLDERPQTHDEPPGRRQWLELRIHVEL